MSAKRKLFVENETGQLQSVILGIGHDQGEQLDINPVSKHHIQNGTYPTEEDNIRELQTVEDALLDEGVEVLRPKSLPNTEQIFTRDIGFVIADKFVVANMKEPVRQPEIKGLNALLEEIGNENIIRLPEGATIEGGDVVLFNDHVFVGIGKRTNWAGFNNLKDQFPHKEFHPIEIYVSDDPLTNILHLDCCFQPVGHDSAIIYPNGFKKRPEAIYDHFDEQALIVVDQDEMNRMFPNIFSISPNKVLVERGFERLIELLEKRGIECIKVDYAETSKLSGLLRCSTLPLSRA